MKKTGSIIILLVSLALSSCALFRGRPAVYPRGVIFPLSQAAAVDYAGKSVGAPVIESGRLYLATDKGVVCGVDLAKRTSAWQFIAFGPLIAAPVLSGDLLAAADGDGRVYGLDKNDGRLRWQRELKEPGLMWLTAAQDELILSGPAGLLLSLAPSDGHETWRFQAPEGLVLPPQLRSWGLPHLLLFEREGAVQFLTLDGRLGTRLRMKDMPSAEPLLDQSRLYFGTSDRRAECLDLSTGKVRWRIGLPGTVTCRPMALGHSLYLWTSHGALYCLDKSDGDILWWTSVASRLAFAPMSVEGKIIVSFSSPSIMSFESDTGKQIGTFDTGVELSGPPQWVDPALLVSGFDSATDKGRLLFLQKEVSVILKASKDSPQVPLDEIVLVAKATGFFKPKYEFFLTGPEPEELVQKASDQYSWSWFPDKAGDYKITVRVADEKEKAEAEIPYTITAAAVKKEPVKKEPAAPAPGTKPAEKQPPVKKPPIKK